MQRFYQAEVLVPSPIPPHLIVFPKKSLKLTRKREQVKRRGSVSQAVISKAPLQILPLAALLNKLLRKFNLVLFALMCWKVWVEDSFSSSWRGCYPRLFYCYFDLMMFVTFALADSLQRSCSALPFRERMQMCRSLRLWYSMNSPPPLPLNDDGDKCEFAAEQCKAKSVGETQCCASRRCAKHAQEEKYVCNCWIVQVSTARKAGVPERRMQQKDVKQTKVWHAPTTSRSSVC